MAWFIARGIGTVLLVPVIEELFFRDYLETKLQISSGRAGKLLAALATAGLFAAWQTVLPGYDRTHHLMGTESVTVDGETATTTANIYATHILENEGEDTWIFIVDYQHELAKTANGWKITFMRANLRAQLGNEDLQALATERVASGQ